MGVSSSGELEVSCTIRLELNGDGFLLGIDMKFMVSKGSSDSAAASATAAGLTLGDIQTKSRGQSKPCVAIDMESRSGSSAKAVAKRVGLSPGVACHL